MQRVAVITGAAGGIGRATAGAFKREGWTTIGVDRRQPAECELDRFVEADLACAEAGTSVIEGIRDLGRIDALVNNAAVQIARPLVETTAEDWQAVFNVNVRAAALITRAAVEYMKDRNAAVVNVGSVHAIATSSGLAAYAASKGALVAMTRAAALELAPMGIRVNAVLPGAVDTRMLAEGLERSSLGKDARANLTARTPLGRIGRPEEIAEAILFLADASKSSFITGQTLVVDGGATARLSTE